MKKDNLLNSLELSLTIGCSLDCDYCPQGLLLREYYESKENREKKLSLENFKLVLEKIRGGSTLSFCGMSEPFLNSECADMILYAYEKGYKICLNTTLVGMQVLDFEKIKDVKFENFILHIPDKENHSKFVITEEYLKLLKLVNDNINIDYYSCHGTVHDAVKEIIDKDKYAGITLRNRAGNLKIKGIENRHIDGKIICYHGSEKDIGGWMPVMFPDGSLVLCCQDYGMKHVLGNLIQQSWDEICEGKEYKKFRDGLNDDSIDILCRNCSDAKKVESLMAMRLRELVVKGEQLWGEEGLHTAQVSAKMQALIKRFADSDTVCVFGLGKLWRDHYYQEYWHEGFETTLFSDNNPEFWGKCINGVECVEPYELIKYKKLLVVVFVKNGESIISQLKGMDINNVVSINEILDICRDY